MELTKNLGSLDRILRMVVGAAMIMLTIVGTIGAWGWLGAILVITPFFKFCPIYRIIGLKTCRD